MGMIINRRRVCDGKKLPYDAEIEYLESSGTQYIDTEIYLASTIGMQVEINVFHYGTSHGRNIFGSNDKDGFNAFFRSYNGIGLYLCNDYILLRVLFLPNVWHTINWEVIPNGTSQVNIDEVNYLASERTLTQSDTTFRLFTQVAHEERRSLIRISTCKLYEGGVLVRDFIPVRVGTTGYMYDKVSKQLFGNSGTGSFILGSDK